MVSGFYRRFRLNRGDASEHRRLCDHILISVILVPLFFGCILNCGRFGCATGSTALHWAAGGGALAVVQ